LARREDYNAYVVANILGVLIMKADNKSPVIGIVWPGYAVWVDFTNPNVHHYWSTVLD